MGDRLFLVLRIASGVLVFSGYLALASVLQYGPGIVLLPLILLSFAPVGAWLERRVYPWRVLRRAAALIYMFFIPFSLTVFGLMDAVIALVVFIQAYLLLGDKNERIYYEIYLMAFFLLLAAVVQSPEPLIAIALLLFGVSAVWAFTALRMQSEAARNPARGAPEVRPLTAPTARPGPGTEALGNVFDFGLFLSLSVLSLLVVVLTVVVFLFTPRVEAGWLGRRDPQQAVTGLSETVSITGGTNIAEDQSVLMHVRFPEEPAGVLQPSRALYWRVATMARFGGDEWSRRGLNHHYEPGVEQVFTAPSRTSRHTDNLEEGRRRRDNTRGVMQLVYMDEVPSQGVPVLDLPQGVRILGDPPNTSVSWDGNADFTLQLQTRGSRRLQYEAYSEIIARDPDVLRQAPLDYRYMEARDYSMLTYHELLPETQQLVRELTDAYPSVYGKVLALEDFLGGESFAYTLEVPLLPARNGMDAFINDIRRGHCEFFASALALMTRSLGIPARVVSGFRGGEYLPGEEAYLVRASMAHLWVEVLIPDHGWVRFDPSPRSEMAPTGFQRMQMVWAVYLLRAKMFWFQEVVGFEGGIRLDQINWPWRGRTRPAPPQPSEPVVPDEEQEARSLYQYIALLRHPFAQWSAIAACLLGGAFVWQKWRENRDSIAILTADQQRIRRLYRRFLRALAALGIDCNNKTAGELQRCLKELGIDDLEQLDEFVALYNAVRFGGRPLTREQQITFKRRLRQLRSRTL